jgi:hypothetical protein
VRGGNEQRPHESENSEEPENVSPDLGFPSWPMLAILTASLPFAGPPPEPPLGPGPEFARLSRGRNGNVMPLWFSGVTLLIVETMN